jgi:osmoprotectant transport system permease protein
LLLLVTAAGCDARDPALVVGSKNFTESYILGEIMAQLLEDRGYRVERKHGLGGTLIGFGGLREGDIDLYAEYSGTLEQAILNLGRRVDYAELQSILKERFDVELLEPLGLNNTYAIAVRRDLAERRALRKISDLARHPDLRYGFSPDFMERSDCWPGLAPAYGLTAQPLRMEHSLTYKAIVEGKLDVMDAYSTDGEIPRYDLVLLEDDKAFFPQYLAAPLVRGSVDPKVKAILGELAGRFTNERMQSLNATVLVDQKSFAEVARQFLVESGLVRPGAAASAPSKARLLLARTLQHLKLTVLSLAAAIAVAVPLGALIYRVAKISRPVIYGAGVLQTIPAIALLAFMLPFFGTGELSAMTALFVYALLPILRNTAAALFSIDPTLKKVSVGMGLTAPQRLLYIELPLAAPMILAGVRTAAVANIGFATLAAFIGAGGLGDPIVTGLALNRLELILEGAVPAALLAVLTELGFELVERLLVPRHLLQKLTR